MERSPGEFPLTIRNQRQKQFVFRIGLSLPSEIEVQNEELTTILPGASEFSRINWPCTPHNADATSSIAAPSNGHPLLGLWAVRKILPLQSEIRVYPNLATERKKSPAFLSADAWECTASARSAKAESFESFANMPLAMVSTISIGRPPLGAATRITRVFQVERTQEVYIILDASRLSARPVAGDPDATILERNVTASCS